VYNILTWLYVYAGKITFLCRLIFLAILFAQTIVSEGFGQIGNNIQLPALGVQVSFNDFKHIDRSHSFSGFNNLKTGISISYLQGLNQKTGITATVAGSIIDFTSQKQVNYGRGNKSLLLETDVSLRRKFLQYAFVSPFIQIGLGGSVYKQYWGAFIPAGIGAQLNVSKRTFVLVNAQYRFPVSLTQDAHFYYAVGIAGVIGKSRKTKRTISRPGRLVKSMPKDTDGDGIVDSLDKCVTVPGVIKYNGCPIPDTDGDGITDDRNSCVTTPGVLKYDGCPVPDRDGDKVNDEMDQCPDMPGVTAYKGCPVIRDSVDKKLSMAAKNIFFATGSNELLPESYTALDEVVRILKEHPEVKLDIEGHTDNIGNNADNKLLSARRAKAVLDYLLKNSISTSRLRSFGYGETIPIADNATAEGRAINRRVEMKIRVD
jgi:OOP family OmpA-OmpF porin